MKDGKRGRRTFLKETAAAATAFAATPVGTLAEENEHGTQGYLVNHEWGKLKEVVVGVPNVRLPSKLAEAPKVSFRGFDRVH